MIEFSEDLTTVYSGKEALKKRITTRLSHTTYDIPYYNNGVDIEEFVYGNQIASIKLAFRDLGPDITYNSENKRIQIYDLSFDVGSILEEN